jgi:hypothetical protein
MTARLDYRHHGTRYVFVDAGGFTRAGWPGDDALEHVPHSEARWVVQAMAQREPALLERLCRTLDGAGAWRHGGYARSPNGSDPRVEMVLRALGVQRALAPSGSAPDFARMILLRPVRAARPSAKRPDSPESQALDRALAQLAAEAPGTTREQDSGTLVFRGQSYRFARAGAAPGARERGGVETLSEAELFSLLREWSADPSCSAARKAALVELLSLAEKQRSQRGSTELLLLRRQRVYRIVSAETGPALTPSQLRRAGGEHWIEIEARDKDKLPVCGVELEVQLASGGSTSMVTNALGLARLDNLQAGTLTVRVLAIDGRAWRPLAGAAARASSLQPGARTHVVKAGECIAKIAQHHGFSDWTVLWNDKKNEALGKRRKNPHVLAPGDELVVAPRVYEMARATDARHVIEVMRGDKRVRVWLRTLGDQPLKQLEYDLRYTLGGAVIERPGSAPSDDQGQLEETVPISVHRVHIILRKSRLRLTYDVSSLEAARDDDTQVGLTTGVQQRLHALGYHVAPSEHADAPAGASSALALFQQLSLHRQAPEGRPDAQTLDALERIHTA